MQKATVRKRLMYQDVERPLKVNRFGSPYR
jgi:hypothetical protein